MTGSVIIALNYSPLAQRKGVKLKMSEWACTKIGEEAATVWEYRTWHHAFGTKYNEFFCPFCDVKLTAVLVYALGEMSKSPHFAARKPNEHLYDCNGRPDFINKPENKPAEAHYTTRQMRVPEKLIGRPQPRIAHAPVATKTELKPKRDEVSRRRRTSTLGAATPSTHLLQSIVEPFKLMTSETYRYAKEKGLTGNALDNELKKRRSKIPLTLEDETNYQAAFCSPKFINNRHPRIYHANGRLEKREGGTFSISATSATSVFIVEIVPPMGIIAPKNHAKTMSKLESYYAENAEIKWYAYGKPEIRHPGFVLTIENLDHLYIHNVYQR